MSLGVVIKGPEGVVLAADSRVTLFNQVPNPQVAGQVFAIPAYFDNATKLLKVTGQDYVGAVTYGLGAMMTADGPRTMHSFIPEFERELKKTNLERIPVQDFAVRLSDFYSERWKTLVGRPANSGEEIYFLVGGYDDGAAYGKAFLFQIPNVPIPVEQNAGPGQFGMVWGGQPELVNRLLWGFDAQLLTTLQTELSLSVEQISVLKQKIEVATGAGIPYQFLPLQDCVDLAVFLIRSTITFQKFRMTIRGVGGPVEVATITSTEGFHFVAQKAISCDTA